MREEYAGREVALKAIRPLIDALDESGALPEGVVVRSTGRLPWDDVCTLLDAAAGLPRPVRQIGADGLASALYQYQRRVRLAQKVLTIEDALRFILYRETRSTSPA